MKARFKTVSTLMAALATLAVAGSALGTGLLVNPSTTFDFEGILTGYQGGSVVFDSFDVPLILEDEALPFASSDSQSLGSGYANSEYSLDMDSVFQPTFDTLDLHLYLGVAGEVHGSWDSWSEWSSVLDGSLVGFFEIQDWAATRLTVNMAWSLTEEGGGIASAGLGYNTVTIRGPLAAPDWGIQKGFLFESTVDIPEEWWLESSVFSQELVNLVPGTYMVEFSSGVNSGGMRDGSSSANYGIDMSNDVNVWAQNTIDPDGCLAGVPCPTAADLNASDSVDIADFFLWYQAPVDVTADGVVDTSDEAAMAFLLGMEMVDSNDNGIIDEMEVAPVLPGAGLPAAVELHAAYPNPFNPMTVLSFSLPSAQPVDLAIYDIKGNRIRTLLTAETHTAGRHEVTWNGRNDAGLPTPAGVYFFRLQTKSDVQTGRMMLLK